MALALCHDGTAIELIKLKIYRMKKKYLVLLSKLLVVCCNVPIKVQCNNKKNKCIEMMFHICYSDHE